MTANQAIEYLYAYDIPKSFAGVVPERLFGDYMQYCYMELFKVDEQRLQRLYDSRRLRDFFYGLCRNQAINKRSMFYIHCGELEDLQARVRFRRFDNLHNYDDEEE